MKLLPEKTFVLLYFRTDGVHNRLPLVAETELPYAIRPTTTVFTTGLSTTSIEHKCDCWIQLNSEVNMAFLQKDIVDL